jgi:hypothetical protein
MHTLFDFHVYKLPQELDNNRTLDLMWYTDEATFNRVAPSLKAFR